VTVDMAIMKATDTITVVEGYDAMRIFLETIWRRQGKTAWKTASPHWKSPRSC